MHPPVAGATALVVGGGPGGLAAAEVLATAGVSVQVIERMPSVARKFVLAGRGGLNLTHSEPLESFLRRYGPAAGLLEPAVRRFGPADLRRWCDGLGEPTFVGTSGRVFPESLRATTLLAAWQARLAELGVTIRTATTWTGWSDEPDAGTDGRGAPALFLEHDGRTTVERADVVVLSLGGASWPKVGSDGAWVDLLVGDGVDVTPLSASNCGVLVEWTEVFARRFAGVPVKNVAVRVGGAAASEAPGAAPVRGELMVVDDGLEGGGVYALGRQLRGALGSLDRDPIGPGDTATLVIDLAPDLDPVATRRRLGRARPSDSTAKVLDRSLGLSDVAVGLLREATGNRIPRDTDALAELVHAVPIPVHGLQGLDRAISTAGGVELGELDERYMLRRRPGVFLAGEMLDWDAPTGGYLLQATFSTAYAAAQGAIDWLARR